MKIEKNNKISKKKYNLKKVEQKMKNLSNQIEKYKTMIENTIIYSHKYKSMDIINSNELHVCLSTSEKIFSDLLSIKKKLTADNKISEQLLNNIQEIAIEISNLFRLFGTKNLYDLLEIGFGTNYIKTVILNNVNLNNIFDIVSEKFHPINYKVLDWKKSNDNVIKKNLHKNRIVEDFMIVDKANTLECFDLARTSNNFLTKVYGVKIAFQNKEQRKTLIISGILDETMINCIDSVFLNEKIVALKKNVPKVVDFKMDSFLTFIDSLSLKELLVYNCDELQQKYIGCLSQIKLIKQKTISQVVKEFVANELYNQRKTLIQLLVKQNEPEFQYLAYLLYDLLSCENNGSIDTFEQTLLFDSLPWNIKKYFRTAMKTTIKYTNNLSNFDTNKIPIEQQICLLKASDAVKEKAMTKLKEVKAKSEDSGSKSRAYLEGLLKIPFGIFKNEPILQFIKKNNELFLEIINLLKNNNENTDYSLDKNIAIKDKYTNYEISNYINDISKNILSKNFDVNKKIITEYLISNKKNVLISKVLSINTILKKHSIKIKINHSGKKKMHIIDKLKELFNIDNSKVLEEIFELFSSKCKLFNINNIKTKIMKITNTNETLKNNITKIKNVLDASVYGHYEAKRHIQRIIGQWITGEHNGYCFGFEGPPGIGKTSLARKGLAHCLEDENGNPRPFAFIALGGSSNGSTLSGHNYTYVGSTWGRIVDIIIEKKCLNPIIFIDELDKVSKTEQGKEIIGILTHLVDTTQNESFEDKYFSGIEINLSKALFVFSYNDASLIDKILLDRIHRIKFNHLSIIDKLEVVHKFILPEITTKLNIKGIIKIDDEIIKFIINTYTYESGVRKLKQILFEIYSEINLQLMDLKDTQLPIVLTKENIKFNYLKERTEVIYKKIHKTPKIGIMNGLWANSLGMGGIIPIECSLFPTSTFLDLKLTGMQGDVMKESMNVSKTLAWNLSKKSIQKKLLKNFKESQLQGIHIHCPEGATPKDGPSAGAAITTAIFSLLNGKKIKNNFGMTGEITLQGDVTAIGGLELKILGGIRAGVTHFIYPKNNEKDFQKFIKKENYQDTVKNIKFTSVSHISEIFKIIFI
tara:strand:+ start:4091 stop:7369 length:3279 start_codon:yes stop_codon:yes gene_type:complete